MSRSVSGQCQRLALGAQLVGALSFRVLCLDLDAWKCGVTGFSVNRAL